MNPQSIASSLNGNYLAVANSNSSSVTFFNATGGTLQQPATSSLPPNSTYCVSITFSTSGTYTLTANLYSNDVSLIPVLLGSSQGDGDGSSGTSEDSGSLPLGLIIGTTVGIPVGLTALTAATVGTILLFYKYRQYHHRAPPQASILISHQWSRISKTTKISLK